MTRRTQYDSEDGFQHTWIQLAFRVLSVVVFWWRETSKQVIIKKFEYHQYAIPVKFTDFSSETCLSGKSTKISIWPKLWNQKIFFPTKKGFKKTNSIRKLFYRTKICPKKRYRWFVIRSKNNWISLPQMVPNGTFLWKISKFFKMGQFLTDSEVLI